ncbi:SDR family NAD(P)-dependent oxidoreductase [Dongia sp.]|uniref:SDR family NAD(P)-dependent oxidoreductase n=1 Tax=Dongia sp. TaxID=1977262 RepID=UPI0035B32E23
MITGAASGIGRQIALRLSQQGAAVMLADIHGAGLRETAAMLPGEHDTVEFDVRDEAGWQAAIARISERFGAFDILANCAGVALVDDDILACTSQTWEQTMGINVTGVFLGCRYGLPAMRRGGSIINLGSMRSFAGAADRLAYSTSKSALLGLTRSVALYCAQAGSDIRANIICPGGINTQLGTSLLAAVPDRAKAEAREIAGYPMRRLGEPDEVAWLAVYLASDESRFMTGASLVVDGGFTAQ